MKLRGGGKAQLALLLVCLAGLSAYAIASGTFSSGSSAPASASACLGKHAEEVVQVQPPALGKLRESIARAMPERVGRLYEEGTVVAANAFNDNSPLPPPVSAGAPRPGGYEMRWWAPGGGDVAADVFVFSSPQVAQRFVLDATKTKCRLAAASAPVDLPPQSRDLRWLNPDGAVEADVYLARGARVYRVVYVPSEQRHGRPAAQVVAHALATADALACLLPHAQCALQRPTVPA
jgi:hypothetical protein